MKREDLVGRYYVDNLGRIMVIKKFTSGEVFQVRDLQATQSSFGKYVNVRDSLKCGSRWIDDKTYDFTGSIVEYDDKPFEQIDAWDMIHLVDEMSLKIEMPLSNQINLIHDVFQCENLPGDRKFVIEEIKCDCGAHATGIKAHGVGHSSWCSVSHERISK